MLVLRERSDKLRIQISACKVALKEILMLLNAFERAGSKVDPKIVPTTSIYLRATQNTDNETGLYINIRQ